MAGQNHKEAEQEITELTEGDRQGRGWIVAGKFMAGRFGRQKNGS
jgi:hypothetical protein